MPKYTLNTEVTFDNYHSMSDPSCHLELINHDTGEIREIVRPTFESAMRRLGSELDKDYHTK
jgi:hypothetical protein